MSNKLAIDKHDTYRIEKKKDDLEMEIRIKRPKPPKELRVRSMSLPEGSEATVDLIEYLTYRLLEFGIPKGDTGREGDKGDKGLRGN